MPQRKRKIRGRLAIRAEERAVLGGMLVNAYAHMEGRLNCGHHPFGLHVHSIVGASVHRQSLRCRVLNHRIVIFLGGDQTAR